MMNKQKIVVMMITATFAVFLAGCGKEPEVASPACVVLSKATDPVQKAELLKRCPRSGPEFKASSKKEY